MVEATGLAQIPQDPVMTTAPFNVYCIQTRDHLKDEKVIMCFNLNYQTFS